LTQPEEEFLADNASFLRLAASVSQQLAADFSRRAKMDALLALKNNPRVTVRCTSRRTRRQQCSATETGSGNLRERFPL
jgi:hypothetical protein